MLWFAELAEAAQRGVPHVINDSKTPSGRVHVGALRGVVMHDAVYRALKSRDFPVKYLFGVDDYDPVDEIPAGQGEHFEKYRGAPLCNVPAPAGSTEPDMAKHFIKEFFEVFKELGVEAETYWMRDHYRSGRFNESIDRILSKADVVRKVYKEVSNSVRSDHWYPFQTICENCGRIGTTEVFSYDGKEVEYVCRPNLVKWAKGCNHHGKVSPFDGRGKLPWKLEWVAKWRNFQITIEGAGKDHTTKGGSRDVAVACLKDIFGQEPPMNIPYEFFLVGGKKMSSSKGIGKSARDMADFLPPEVLRFLILRTQPKTPVNFDVEEDFIVKLFNDFDRLHKSGARPDEKELFALCAASDVDRGEFWDANFQLVLTFVQMPHVDLIAEMEKRKGAPLTEQERLHLERRVHAAKHWLENFAAEEDRIHLQETLPARASELTQAQRGFLRELAAALDTTEWSDDALQAAIFNTARLTPVEQAAAFKAVYRVLLDRESGPKAGALMAVLKKDFVLNRFRELPFDEQAFLAETSETREEFDEWRAAHAAKVKGEESAERDGYEEIVVTMEDGKRHKHRVAPRR